MRTFTLLLSCCILFNTFSSYAQPGTLDSSFFDNGISTAFWQGVETYSQTVLINQQNGTIWVTTYYYNSAQNKYQLVIVKKLSNGKADKNFGDKGVAKYGFGTSVIAGSSIMQPDGKIILSGSSYGSSNGHLNYSFASWRFDTAGNLDNSFGAGGEVITDIEDGKADKGFSVALQTDGKIIEAGAAYNGTNYDFALIRYTQNGKIDSSFGTNGKVITDFNGLDDIATSVKIQSNGKIVVAGYTSNGANLDVAIACYKSNGQPDRHFGINGKVTTDVGDSTNVARTLALQENGKIVVGGYVHNGTNTDFNLIRYNMNGKIDSSFGTNGITITDFGYNDDLTSIAIQPDGKIVAGGTSNYDYALARYKANGTINKTFGINGKTITNIDFHGYPDYASSVALQHDGKIVLAGESSNSQIAIARYFGDANSLKNVTANNTANFYKDILNKIYLSPNPAKDILHIQGLSTNAKTISVVDLVGRTLFKTLTSNKEDYTVNVKQFQTGIYFIRIQEKGKIISLKFIKD